MTTDRRLLANRRNAKRSTGPKTPEGKQAASQNSFRHGLSRLMCDPGFSDQVRTLALKVCDESDPVRCEQAFVWAEAELTLQSVRAARVAMLEEHAGTRARLPRAIAQAARLERYERGAIARRKRSIGILTLLREVGSITTNRWR